MKTVLITGASRGIGAAAAKEFSKKGWHVVINYNKNKEKALALAKELSATVVQADISKSDEVLNMYSSLKGQGIHVDAIVNNAGVSSSGLFVDISESEWDEMFAINTKGAFLVTKAFLPDMLSRQSGSIVNISSIWGETGAAAEVCYSASKAALIGMTKALAKELAPSGIRVNCVCPGCIDTDMNKCYSDEERAAIAEDIPLGREGTVEEAAHAIEFLSSDTASYITGQVIGVNGGWYI